eukprot:4177179-Heterocapsa_arctica.AAC.1
MTLARPPTVPRRRARWRCSGAPHGSASTRLGRPSSTPFAMTCSRTRIRGQVVTCEGDSAAGEVA